jgi:hypothetical protein
MTRVDRIADRLSHQVRADRPAIEPVALEDLAPPGAVRRVAQCLRDVEVVPPGRQLEAVELPLSDLGGQILERQIRPLAGEQRDRS